MAKAFDPNLVTPTTPLRLSRALEIAFPAGGMTVSGLRLEASRGRLEIERIAGKDFVTLAAIERMREMCRVQHKSPQQQVGRHPEQAPAADAEIALAALRQRLERRRQGLSAESQHVTPPRSTARTKRSKRP